VAQQAPTQRRRCRPLQPQGYNAAIIAYGQTGTGKTFTMEGGASGASRGIIPRAIEDVFATIGSDAVPNSKFLVRASYLQIYNEVRLLGLGSGLRLRLGLGLGSGCP